MPTATREDTISVRTNEAERRAWTKAAARVGHTLSAWLRWIANREAAKEETDG